MEKELTVAGHDFTVGTLTEYLVFVSVILLMLGAPIQLITGVKLHYFAFIILSIIIFLINASAYVNITKGMYFLLLFFSIIFFLIHKPVDLPFIYSFLTYAVVPFIFFNRTFKNFDFTLLIKAFVFFTFLNFVGVLLQVAGVETPFLALDLVRTEGELHLRYGSIAGGTLALGFTASVAAICAFYLITYYKQNTIYNFSVLFFSIITLLLAQSRRFYFLVFVIILVTYLFDTNKKYNIRRAVFIGAGSIVFLILGFYLAFVFKEKVYFLERAFSIFNFQDDAANLERVTKWALAINTFIKNIWFGIGIGGTGTIGKNFNEETSLEDILVAESFYIKILVECGIFFGIFFIGLFISGLKKSLVALRSIEKSLAGVFFLFFFLESFMSTSLESPLAAVLFWIAMSKLFFYS
jgi:O-antigen ligase